MKMFKILAGREGLLVRPNGDIEPFTTKKYSVFLADDIAIDPIKLQSDSSDFYENPSDAIAYAADSLAKQGYTVFQKIGKKQRMVWYFAVQLQEEDIFEQG